MFGLKADWSLDIKERYFTLGDYAGGEARWCPGCGDHGVLTAIHRICRDKQLPPEKTVAVSGIGCSSRLPHYMGTYGFHGLHGRALPVACGIKSRRPELDIWVGTGDGDCFSIGTAHWIHAVRYNMDMTVLVFDNSIYALTKKQTSPTTPIHVKTNTHSVEGAPIAAHNPLTVTLGISNVSFVAQTIDWNPVHLYETIKTAHDHRGFSFVRILQRCPVYLPNFFKGLQDDPSGLTLLTHEKGISLDKNVARIFPNQQEHDPANMTKARDIAEQTIPVGLLYQDASQPCYEDASSQGREMGVDDKLAGLNAAFDAFAI
ncbi:MAG: 2-oxoglutarate oxidoreductase [Gammaproteobacteria bacterium]|nr:2-oxoglutarate oxidoreductase [Gammaproteobacteria bacterium]